MNQATAACLLALFVCSLAHAQSAADAQSKLEFEVASIKASAPPNGGPIRFGPRGGPGNGDPGRISYSFSSIRDLMVDAYNVKRYQISGGPSWLDSERFDIVAKVPEGATKDQVKVMLQNLMAERFKLALHHETKELPMYALVVGAKGPKLRDSIAPDPPRAEAGPPVDGPPSAARRFPLKMGPDGCPEAPPMIAGRPGNFMMITPNGECMFSNGQTTDAFASQLSNRFDRPIVDQTGLKGKYDFKLRYDPASVPGGRGGLIGPVMMKDGPGPGPGVAGGDTANRVAPDGEPPPNIFAAIQEQLGLKLDARKGSVDLLVIDHVEKTPTEN